jgi:hypothetical protein
MNRNDREALKLAVAACTEGDAAELRDLIKSYGNWEKAAKFSARCMQGRHLKLKPWEVPPARIANPDNPDEGFYHPDQPGTASDGRVQAARLLQRMLALGISKWQPDPLTAIEEAERSKVTDLNTTFKSTEH